MAGARSLRVLLAEDEPKLALAVQALCETQDDLEIVGVVTTGEDAVEAARREAPDVVVLDVHLEGTDGIEGACAIRAASPDTGVVIYSGDEADVERARSLGFAHVLLKGAVAQELIFAITAAGSPERKGPLSGPFEVEPGGLEPPTSWVRSRRSPS
jgi:DNA-binding NarL/FixJ family response regulator